MKIIMSASVIKPSREESTSSAPLHLPHPLPTTAPLRPHGRSQPDAAGEPGIRGIGAGLNRETDGRCERRGDSEPHPEAQEAVRGPAPHPVQAGERLIVSIRAVRLVAV